LQGGYPTFVFDFASQCTTTMMSGCQWFQLTTLARATSRERMARMIWSVKSEGEGDGRYEGRKYEDWQVMLFFLCHYFTASCYQTCVYAPPPLQVILVLISLQLSDPSFTFELHCLYCPPFLLFFSPWHCYALFLFSCSCCDPLFNLSLQ